LALTLRDTLREQRAALEERQLRASRHEPTYGERLLEQIDAGFVRGKTAPTRCGPAQRMSLSVAR
jgi:hypothetical protein